MRVKAKATNINKSMAFRDSQDINDQVLRQINMLYSKKGWFRPSFFIVFEKLKNSCSWSIIKKKLVL